MKRLFEHILRRLARPSYATDGEHYVRGKTIRVDIIPYNRALWVSSEDGGAVFELDRNKSVAVQTQFGTGRLIWEPGSMRLMN